MKKFWINACVVCAVVGILVWVVIEDYGDRDIESDGLNAVENMSFEENTVDESGEKIREYPKEEIVDEFKGYFVSAKLEIPKISLETYVLKNYSPEALNVSVTKFWGADANQIGNFCVAGHNFQNSVMFHNLKNLDIGDCFFVSDNVIGKVEYEIYDLYKVFPDDVSCLSQETNGERVVTLITCTNDSKKRIIVKAREVSNKS